MVVTGLAFISGAPGPGEFLLIFLVVLLLFGPRRLPAAARRLGKMLSELRKASDDFKNELMRMDQPVPSVSADTPDADSAGSEVPDGAAPMGAGDEVIEDQDVPHYAG